MEDSTPKKKRSSTRRPTCSPNARLGKRRRKTKVPAKKSGARSASDIEGAANGLPPLPHLMSPKEAARFLGVSERTLERWRRDGTGPSFYRLGTAHNGPVRYSSLAVIAFMSERPRPSVAEMRRRTPPHASKPVISRKLLRGRQRTVARGFRDLVGDDWTHFVGLSCASITRSETLLAKRVRRFLERLADRTEEHVTATWVIEAHASGSLHAHLLLRLAPNVNISETAIGRLWRHGIADVRPYDAELGGAEYIAKELGRYDWEPPTLVHPRACRDAGDCGADRDNSQG